MSTSRQADGKDIPVYTLDLKEGLTYMCDSRICEAKGGRQSFWRRKDIPGFQGENKWKENTLVPVGWKVHRVQGKFFYQCPICWRRNPDWTPPYIQIHHPGQVESDFVEGGIPDISNKNGGRRRKKRTRKRRKMKTKRKRTKRSKRKR